MVIPAAIRAELAEHARADAPNEACGLIVLRDGRAERYVPGRNTLASPYRFQLEVDPDTWFLEDEGFELAVFHSHPETEPRPSRTDRELSGLWAGKPFLIYGLARTTALYPTAAGPGIGPALRTAWGAGPPERTLLALATALTMVGFGFKCAMAPFHLWVPDVYDGAPTPITAWLSVASKGAGFAAFIRVFAAALPVERAMVASASVLFCLTGCFLRHERKYGEGGYRMLVAEAGHISQNLILAATALGLGARPFGGVFDHLLNDVLGLTGADEQFLLAVLVGRGDGTDKPRVKK